MRLLLVGFFSTVGDIEVLEVVKGWLNEKKIRYDISAYSKMVNDGFSNAVNLSLVDPHDYTHLILICGPFWKDFFFQNKIDLDRFRHCNIIGINLSMIESPEFYNPFDTLIARDFHGYQQPDLSFLMKTYDRPVVGLCLAPEQHEYGLKQNHKAINSLLYKVIKTQNFGVIKVNTQWPFERNEGFISSPDAYESVCKKMDIMITTRLHGMVLALKIGIPVIAIDPIIGGGKVFQQGKAINWPLTFLGEEIDNDQLMAAIEKGLTSEYKDLAIKCSSEAVMRLQGVKEIFFSAMNRMPNPEKAYDLPKAIIELNFQNNYFLIWKAIRILKCKLKQLIRLILK